MTRESYSPDELASIKALQRLAYDCAEDVAAGLQAVRTEREAAARLGAAPPRLGGGGHLRRRLPALDGDAPGLFGGQLQLISCARVCMLSGARSPRSARHALRLLTVGAARLAISRRSD